MSITIVLGGRSVDLTPDPIGYHGTIELDGQRYLIHTSLTRIGPTTANVAKARMRRYVKGIELDA